MLVDELSRLTSDAISDISADPEILNLRMLIESQFDAWTTELFPLLQGKKIGCYKFVVDLMHRAGHTVATEELVRKNISVIRAKRGLPTNRTAGVTLTVTPPAPAGASTSQMVQPANRPAMAPFPLNQVVVTSPLEAVPGVSPVEVTEWVEQMQRLNNETASSPWTAHDQWMWEFFENISVNILGRPLRQNLIPVERYVNDPVKKNCLASLLAKRRR